MHDPENPLHQHLPQMEQQVGSEMYELSKEGAKLHNAMIECNLESYDDGMALVHAQTAEHNTQARLNDAKNSFVRVQSGIIVMTSLALLVPVIGAVWAWGIRVVFGG